MLYLVITLLYTGTLYEENCLNTTMLARQSSQPTYDDHWKQMKHCVNHSSPFADGKVPFGTTKDATYVPSRYQ